MSITPSKQQGQAIKDIAEWFKFGTKPYFYLAGYAGSGKTTIAKIAVEECGIDPDSGLVCYGAYTGKAALMMRRNGLYKATTIHKLIYIPIPMPDGSVRFEINNSSIVKQCRLVVLDECSMIDDQMAIDLLKLCAQNPGQPTKILVLGDPGQLPPIKDEGMFTREDPDFFLSEIHRQAKDNPIILMATLARQGEKIPEGDYKQVVHIKKEDLSISDILKNDQVITGKNTTRLFLNQMIKDELGFTEVLPMQKGVKLVCLKNEHNLGLLNGMLFETSGGGRVSNSRFYFWQMVKSLDIVVANIGELNPYYVNNELSIQTGWFYDYIKKRTPKEIKIERDATSGNTQFDFGYAITCHKSQGSQWDRVLIYDDGFGMWDKDLRKKWMYTAITRAANELIIAS